MPIHSLRTSQVIQASLTDAWNFFSNPRNLERITPKALGFTILSELPDMMYAGMMIRYRVHPFPHVPMTWLTEITHVEEGRLFVDEQRVGPYRLWHHEHHFRDLGDGSVEMRDLITYQLPMGWLSEPIHSLLVKPQLQRIFAYREKVVSELF